MIEENKKDLLKKQALMYHSKKPQGKLAIIATKSCQTQKDLSLAYSPGVACPVLEIKNNSTNAYKYTCKGNLVAVITNGTAALGLGNVGALASKPIMEGKAILFKKFANIDVFDIEIDSQDPDEFINTVVNIAPTFGGINLEDIKAPECFYIEQKIIEKLNIPVMHDDQHGTAIIVAAGLLNALLLQNKKLTNCKLVCLGGGSAGIAILDLLVNLGLKKENIFLVDKKGLIIKEYNLDKYKQTYARDESAKTLEQVIVDADVFIGVAAANLLTKDMVKSMNKKPIVFALSNPNPEISYEDAKAVRNDLVMATGRSDYPNQINNVLGFPYIFRGALDAKAKLINLPMKLAAVKAISELAKKEVPNYILSAYNLEKLEFGSDYIIPKPFDKRLFKYVSDAVYKSAIESGVDSL